MDPGAFVQENKRWLIGCAVGCVVFWIAGSVIDSVYDVNAARAPQRALLSVGSSELYDGKALAAAKEEAEQLAAEKQRLQKELAFEPTSRYQLAGKGHPGEYLFQVGRALRQSVLTAANERGVQLADKDLFWDVPTGVDEIGGVLFGLELLDETQKRVFAAHDAVRAAHPDAMGLRAILKLCVEPRRNQRGPARGPRPGEVDLRDLVVQERVSFQFQGDEPTLLRFFEACRQPGRTLVIESWTLTQPGRAGDGCTAKGTLQGIAFKEKS
ncbi:MAG TPA: hypothetical protein VFZ65_19915 [Planctomycetota bacterium]|nr:hypothetical protein [Planctomycetota bacterium]